MCAAPRLTALPARWPRAAVLTLAASLGTHALLLGGERPRHDARPPARATSVALLPAPAVPAVAPEPAAVPPPPRHATAKAPADPAPRRDDATTPPSPAADVALLRLPGATTWHYRLRQAGQDGEAELAWQPLPDGRYVLRLTRRLDERALPAMQSQGRTGPAGLSPERYALQRGGQDRQAINFDAEGRRVSFSASPAQLDLPDGAQDRLSWWLQLAAVVQASRAQRSTAAGPWRVWVAGLRGDLREWTFDLVPPEPGDGGIVHLRRSPLGEHDPGVDVWLDPRHGHWPVRLRQGDPETRGFQITLDAVNS